MRPRQGTFSTARPGTSRAEKPSSRVPQQRITDYDSIADGYDRRYSLLHYDGVRDALLNFLTPAVSSALEVGCGTGHWLREIAGRVSFIAGVEPSGPMLLHARQ